MAHACTHGKSSPAPVCQAKALGLAQAHGRLAAASRRPPSWLRALAKVSIPVASRSNRRNTRGTPPPAALQAAAVAMIREWPDPEFIAETVAAFPDKAIANVEEARVLFSEAGYTYLDVRPALELEEVGRVRSSVNVPIMNAKWKFNAETREKEVDKTPNPKFLEVMRKKFPNLDHPLLVACSDGKTYSIDALTALDEAGYTNLVALRGGFYAWFRVFDNKLNRRYVGEYAQVYDAGGDSCGIHSTGAGFEKMDAVDPWVPRRF